ncbi:MJ1255/VC2487 family glycosyltransferase [Paraglaciecola sp. 2405UD69-4]|uniref:MJ1255/VC2487 family glycosyltransferase n=1 Tax=Paraglaciecola sp. 2405UD69-4 TaxID=3391836 RepID=UPI0039C97E96
MRILYGVQGTGNGHISRARIMAKAFNKRTDVEVDFVFSGREHSKYFDMEVFGQYQTLQGLSFVTHNGAINHWKTLKAAKIKQFFHDIKHLDVSHYDLVLNDFEPVTAWAAKNKNIPSISISHQAAFSHPIPKREANLIDNLITRYFAPTDIQLGIHWYHYGYPILPPFIDPEYSNERTDKSILVYLPFEEVTAIQEILSPFAEHDFVSFHPSIKYAHKHENVCWHPTAKAPFHKVLSRCNGVIANAGFELASECLQFKKRMLLKPLNGQFEQISNAQTLFDLGLCQFMRALDLDAIEQWLQSDTPDTMHFSANPNTLIDWILEKKWSDTKTLCSALWRQVTFPDQVLKQLNQVNF